MFEHTRPLRDGHAPRVTLGGATFCVVTAGTLGSHGDQWRRRSHRPCARRPLPPAHADRRGRERSRLRGRRRPAAAPGRGEGAPRRARRRRRFPPPLPRRGAGRRVAAPSERDGGLRLGRRRRAVHGARVAAGRQPPRPARHRRAAHSRSGRPRRPSGHRRARVRARARARAPRHQAGEPPLRRARHPPRRRLRSGARARRGELDRAGGFGGRHRSIRGARAGVGRAARRPRRSLRARDRARRVGHRHRSRDVRHRDRHARGAPTHTGARAGRSSVVSVRSSSAPADRIRPSAIRTPRRWARHSPTRRARSRARSRSCSRGSAPTAAGSSIPRRSVVCRRGCSTRTRPPARRTRPRRSRWQHERTAAIAARSCRSWWHSWSSPRWWPAASRSPATGGGTVAVPSVVGFSLDEAKIRVATDGLTVTTVERNADDPKGVVIGQTPGRRVVRGRRHQGAARRLAWTTAGADPRRAEPVARRRARRGSSRTGSSSRSAMPNNETVPYNHVIDTDPADRPERAARFRDHVAGEQRSRAGADPRRRRT